MDLPTCPSCGQSVLDDEPVSCPFCGAAMDGTSGPTRVPKPAPVKTKQKPAEKPQQPVAKTTDREDDPFDIGSSPQARRAIACSPKRTKSRPVPVTCPMCDTRGYIPRAAVGKQVRCSNSDCMVPVFTAPEPGRAKAPTAPGRMSQQAAEQEAQLSRPTKARSPLAIYGLLGAVLLAAGLALKFYLDREPDEDQFNRPIEIPTISSVENDPEQADTDSKPPAVDESQDVRTIASRLAVRMVQTAQMSLNRDKALCRRLSGDAFLRLGDEIQAKKELDQLLVVSRQRNLVRDYYRISPLAGSYWQAVAQNDQSAADDIFTRMSPDAKTIPRTGLLATEAAIQWGSILVHRQKRQQALDLVERLAIDDSVRLHVDRLHRAVWSAVTVSGMKAGHRSDSPVATLIWTDPVATAIAVELTLQRQWESAISWAEIRNPSLIQDDLLTEIARQAVRLQAPPNVVSRLREAATPTTAGQQRMEAVLAQTSDELLQAAVAGAHASEITVLDEMMPLGDVLSNRLPDFVDNENSARILMELGRSAAARDNTEVAADSIVRLCDSLMISLPPTDVVREASLELDRSTEAIEERIRDYLGKPANANMTPDFNRYRRGLDRLAAAVEARRLLLIRMLCGIAEIDGGSSLNLALEQSSRLAHELKLDPLCQLIAGEAVLAGGSVPELAAVTSVTIPRGQRTDAHPEDSLAPIWLAAAQASVGTYDNQLLRVFESTLLLPGLRSCLQRRITESRATEADLRILNAATAMKNVSCRENCLWTAAVWLVRRGQLNAVEEWTANGRLSATDRALTLSGIISGLEIPPAPTE